MTKMTEMSSKLSTVSTMQTAKHGGVGLGLGFNVLGEGFRWFGVRV